MSGYISYYYDAEYNVMIDRDGFEVFNIFAVVDPNMFYLFKTKKQGMVVYGKSGERIQLVYESQR